MNSCILMAEIIQEPQLRYTPDSQLEVVEMMVEFPGLRAEDPTSKMKVVGWGNLAKEIQENYHQGDRVILEGRLSMNTIERQPEGFKEKRAEFTVSGIHSLTAAATGATRPLVSPVSNPAPASNVVPMATRKQPAPVTEPVTTPVGYQSAQPPAYATSQREETYSEPANQPDEDEIPF